MLSTLSLHGHLPAAPRPSKTPDNVTGQERQIRNTSRNGPFVAVTFPLAYLVPFLNGLFQCTPALFNTPNIAYTLRSIELPDIPSPCPTTPRPFSLSINPHSPQLPTNPGVVRWKDARLVQRYCQWSVSCFSSRGQAVCHRGAVPCRG